MTRVPIWIHGITGKMGREIVALLGKAPLKERWALAGGSSRHDSKEALEQGLGASSCILDFTGQEGSQLLADALARGLIRGKSVLIGSTGLSSGQKERWCQLAKEQNLRLMIAPNTSLGILLTLKAALAVAVGLCVANNFDIELEEAHHRDKADAPSGTALWLADNIAANVGAEVVTQRQGLRKKGELAIHPTRGGGVFGEHCIRFLGDHEEISIRHRAYSRTLFASGAVVLLSWLHKQQPGVHDIRNAASQL